MNCKTKALIAHILATPNLAADLITLHDLALYDSGSALLGTDEKNALWQAKQLAAFISDVDEEDLKALLSK